MLDIVWAHFVGDLSLAIDMVAVTTVVVVVGGSNNSGKQR